VATMRRSGEPGLAGDCAALLRNGGLLILPTETLYGLVCDALSPEALARLVAAKGREAGKPIPLIAPDAEAVRALVDPMPRLFAALADKFWPGPLTLVLPARPALPPEVTGGARTVGVRVPGPSLALDVARAFGGPLTATSANPAGKPAPSRIEDLDPELAEKVDMVVDGGEIAPAGSPGGAGALPSTLLDLASSPPRLLRAGALGVPVTAFLENNAPGFSVRAQK
jgi:L-threonylcarbamoyladenylate synthase